MSANVGYRAAVAVEVAEISYRQLDYWARTNLVIPSVRVAEDSGSRRLYSTRDITTLAVVGSLLNAGLSLVALRKILSAWRAPEPLNAQTGQALITCDVHAIHERIRKALTRYPAEPALMWAVG